MDQFRPLFRLFSSFSHSKNKDSFNFNNTNCKKHRWCALDSNPGLQDGRHRRNHGAMAMATLNCMHKVWQITQFKW